MLHHVGSVLQALKAFSSCSKVEGLTSPLSPPIPWSSKQTCNFSARFDGCNKILASFRHGRELESDTSIRKTNHPENTLNFGMSSDSLWCFLEEQAAMQICLQPRKRLDSLMSPVLLKSWPKHYTSMIHKHSWGRQLSHSASQTEGRGRCEAGCRCPWTGPRPKLKQHHFDAGKLILRGRRSKYKLFGNQSLIRGPWHSSGGWNNSWPNEFVFHFRLSEPHHNLFIGPCTNLNYII